MRDSAGGTQLAPKTARGRADWFLLLPLDAAVLFVAAVFFLTSRGARGAGGAAADPRAGQAPRDIVPIRPRAVRPDASPSPEPTRRTAMTKWVILHVSGAGRAAGPGHVGAG